MGDEECYGHQRRQHEASHQTTRGAAGYSLAIGMRLLHRCRHSAPRTLVPSFPMLRYYSHEVALVVVFFAIFSVAGSNPSQGDLGRFFKKTSCFYAVFYIENVMDSDYCSAKY